MQTFTRKQVRIPKVVVLFVYGTEIYIPVFPVVKLIKKVSLRFYPLSFLSVMVKSKCNLSKLEFNVKLLMLPIMNRELGMSEARKGSWFGSVHMFVDFIKELFVDSLVI